MRREKENKGQFEAFCERTSLQNNSVFIVTQRQFKKKSALLCSGYWRLLVGNDAVVWRPLLVLRLFNS